MSKDFLRKFARINAILILCLWPSVQLKAQDSDLVNGYFPVLPRGAGDEAAPQLLPVVGNAPLEGEHKGITRAVIIIHDYTRDAGAQAAMLASLAGASNTSTFTLAPQFMLDVDMARTGGLPPDQKKLLARWPLDGWIYGNESIAMPPQKSISSFTVLDLLLMYLGSNQFFPDLRSVTIAGHGNGGDFVQRYAAAGQAPDILQKQNIEVRFLVANASSYLYFTAPRFLISKPGARPSLGTPDAAQCPTWNAYPYGLEALNDYVKRTGPTEIKLRYPARRITYLTGEKTDTNDAMLDRNCAAMMQAPSRMMRMEAYQKYLAVTFGDTTQSTHRFIALPKAGYEPALLFGSGCGLSVLFGDGGC